MKVAPIEVTYVDHMGTDLSVVNAARVSFDKESSWLTFEHVTEDEIKEIHRCLREGDTRLIRYLAKYRHYSPFNHTFVTVRVKAPIFVARQLVKHEYMPWNEISRRYVDSEPEFWIPEVVRAKADNVKQGSAEESVTDNSKAVDIIKGHSQICLLEYEHLKAMGVCPEQARIVLPHNLMTEWYWSGTLKAFHKMLELRLDPHTQVETRIVAQQIRDIIEPLFPVSLPALLENK